MKIDDDGPQSANSQLMLSSEDGKQPVCTPLDQHLSAPFRGEYGEKGIKKHCKHE